MPVIYLFKKLDIPRLHPPPPRANNAKHTVCPDRNCQAQSEAVVALGFLGLVRLLVDLYSLVFRLTAWGEMLKNARHLSVLNAFHFLPRQ